MINDSLAYYLTDLQLTFLYLVKREKYATGVQQFPIFNTLINHRALMINARNVFFLDKDVQSTSVQFQEC